ncbi:MAG: tripartite tricarboxylate transporter substrate binding protein [Betaproteobacteria bacterium]|nr:MAG: tripartite tricarboxylate transporter substrate binding protein [Betaproteobacteria bacterium]
MKSSYGVRLVRVLLVLALAGAAWVAQAQTYPVKPVRMIVPFAPGGNTDIIARIVVPGMSKSLGQQIIIDNRGGAGSMIGTDMAAKSPPDGYTVLMVSAAHVINPAMVKKLPFDPVRSFAAISKVADVPSALVVHPSLPVKTVKDLVALAKSNPGKLNYGSAGRGSIGHLSAELLGSLAQIKMTHVPYKGAGPALVDTMAGHVELLISSMPAVIGQSRAGKLRMIAQGGEKRSPAAANVPTMIEGGVPGFVVTAGFGLFAPADTPRPIIDRVHAALKASLADASVRQRLSGEGADPVGSTPEEYEQFTRSEIDKWIKVARNAGIQPE